MAVLTPANVRLKQQIDISNQFGTGLKAGEALTAGAPCYVKISDTLVYMCGGTGVTALGDEGCSVHGYSLGAVVLGEAVTLLKNVKLEIADGTLAIGKIYIDVSAATKGRLATTATINNLRPCAQAYNESCIEAFQVFHTTLVAVP